MKTDIIYGKKAGLEIVPVYFGESPIGFRVVWEGTKELVEEFGTLCEAEQYLDGIAGMPEPPPTQIPGVVAEMESF